MSNSTTWTRRSVTILPEQPYSTKMPSDENFFACYYPDNPYGAIVPSKKHSYPRNQMFSTAQEERVKHESEVIGRPYTIISKIITEFIGDLIFVFIGVGQALAGGGILVAAFAHGLTIFVLIASLGHISGGHFNPAVTLSVLLCGKMKILDAVAYITAQLLGGFFGALLCRGIMNDEQWNAIGAGATVIQANHVWYQAIIAEVVMTWLLTQTVILTAVDTSANFLAPLAIGLSITAGIFAGGTVSAASINPARSFGPAVVSLLFKVKTSIWPTQYAYYVGPPIGAFLTAAFYRAVLARGDDRLFF